MKLQGIFVLFSFLGPGTGILKTCSLSLPPVACDGKQLRKADKDMQV